MIKDIIVCVLCIMFTVGFYTGKLDWVLIYYGCAPKKVKDKLPGKKIMTVAFTCMLVATVAQLIVILSHAFGFIFFVDIFHVVSMASVVTMLVWTVILTVRNK